MLSRVMSSSLEAKQSVRHAALGQFTYAQDHSLLKEGEKDDLVNERLFRNEPEFYFPSKNGLVTGFTVVWVNEPVQESGQQQG